MRSILSVGLTILAAAVSFVPAVYGAGFNIGGQDKNGNCKTQQDWINDFKAIKTWSTGKTKFNAVKIFTTSDCNVLANAAPAAIKTGMKIWIGVWAFPFDKYQNEKAALLSAFKAHPNLKKWVAGINVGSESLYRKEIAPQQLADQINEIKALVKSPVNNPSKAKILVGCADTWTAWVDGANQPVVKAVDIVIMNAFPYWQGATIENALNVFKLAISNTRQAVGMNKRFMVGETGWPAKGENFGAAFPSYANQKKYWRAAACWLEKTKYPWYWFSAFNEPHKTNKIVEKHFGVAKVNTRGLKFSLKC